MKKLLALILLAAFALPVFAQDDEPQNELSVSYGILANSNVIDFYTDLFSAVFGEDHKNESDFGPISIEYFHKVKPRFSVGAVAVYCHHGIDLMEHETKVGDRGSSYYTLMPAVKFNWMKREKVELYSKAAVGATLCQFDEKGTDRNGNKVDDTDTEFFFNFQVSLIGVEFGGKNWRGFGELGMGEQGVILGGIRYRF